VIVVVAPGQGSQTPGFLAPWVSEQNFREHLEAMSDVVGLDLVAHGTTSDSDTIRDTRIAQPLIVAASLLAFGALSAARVERIGAVAGHSVGEVTAAAASGILTEHDALAFVRERGRAMADAASLHATGMSAVVGGDETALIERLGELGLEPANVNGGGQIVVAGPVDALAALASDPLPLSRVIPLSVAGAFHTRYMRSAGETLRSIAAGMQTSDPRIPVYTNHDGSSVSSGEKFLALMVGQVSSPVRWDLTMAAFAADGITGMIELSPAGALVGLARRGLKGVPAVAVKTPDDLPAAFEMLDAEMAAPSPDGK